MEISASCILSKFYIKPQLSWIRSYSAIRCILSKFYIKPQRDHSSVGYRFVVSYRNSTSNHNSFVIITVILRLYLIEILHQTTTPKVITFRRHSCILSKFYIKPQHKVQSSLCKVSCILSKFYIKPQRQSRFGWCHGVVSYRNSTSNHNRSGQLKTSRMLYLIEILHQTTTPQLGFGNRRRCILSKFYIKPQLQVYSLNYVIVVSYRNSTSNHNEIGEIRAGRIVVSYRNSTSNHNCR